MMVEGAWSGWTEVRLERGGKREGGRVGMLYSRIYIVYVNRGCLVGGDLCIHIHATPTFSRKARTTSTDISGEAAVTAMRLAIQSTEKAV